MTPAPRKSPASLALPMVAVMMLLANLPLVSLASSKEQYKILPGTALGVARLGMTQPQAHEAMGAVDKTSKLPDGRTVETAEWKEAKGTTFINYLYDGKGKIIQIETNAPVPATTGGISIKSSISQVRAAYPAVCEVKRDDRPYLIDAAHGIAFGLQTDKTAQHELFDIVILPVGQKLQDLHVQ